MVGGGGLPEGVGGAGWREGKGGKNQDNCNSIINKIYFKKIALAGMAL